MWVAYSKWPDKAARDASWPQEGEPASDELPAHIREAVMSLKQCMDSDRPFPEIHMELIEEVSLLHD